MVRALMNLVAVASEFFLLLIPLIVVGAFAVIGVRRNRRDIKSQRREIAELRDTLSATHREISARGKVEVELNESLRKAEAALRGYIDYVNGRVEHLNFEFGKMACLPLNHPQRKALVDEVIVKMLPIQQQLDHVQAEDEKIPLFSNGRRRFDPLQAGDRRWLKKWLRNCHGLWV